MATDPAKAKSIAEVIEAKGVKFIKMHLTRPSRGKCASSWRGLQRQ